MRGIILSGGKGTRLYPSTNVISKHLLPIFDKPMIYYPIATLMLVGIREIIIITSPKDLPNYQKLLRDGSQWGLSFEYLTQAEPEGIAQAFIIAENQIKGKKVCLILGDNLLYGKLDFLRRAISEHRNATIFAYEVDTPEDYGVVEFDNTMNVKRIIEKPKEFVSKYAIPGIYLFDEKVAKFALTLKPSGRGELEITDLLQLYLERKELQVHIIGRGVAWLDTGTPSNLIDAALFIRAIEQRQGRKIGCLEEIALTLGYITFENYKAWLNVMPNSEYKTYCLKVLKEFIK
ncbi:MAG: glucose-1-phosphate thymidylyltransferase RfbA [Candidatus Kapaibacteriales bacterium]